MESFDCPQNARYCDMGPGGLGADAEPRGGGAVAGGAIAAILAFARQSEALHGVRGGAESGRAQRDGSDRRQPVLEGFGVERVTSARGRGF